MIAATRSTRSPTPRLRRIHPPRVRCTPRCYGGNRGTLVLGARARGRLAGHAVPHGHHPRGRGGRRRRRVHALGGTPAPDAADRRRRIVGIAGTGPAIGADGSNAFDRRAWAPRRGPRRGGGDRRRLLPGVRGGETLRRLIHDTSGVTSRSSATRWLLSSPAPRSRPSRLYRPAHSASAAVVVGSSRP